MSKCLCSLVILYIFKLEQREHFSFLLIFLSWIRIQIDPADQKMRIRKDTDPKHCFK